MFRKKIKSLTFILILSMILSLLFFQRTYAAESYDFFPSVTAIAGDRSATLSWDAISDADGYYVYSYKKTINSETYTWIATTTETSYTQTDLTNGDFYTYVVSTYYKNVYSPYKMAKKIGVQPKGPPPSAPVVTASSGDGTITLTWNPVSSSTGYVDYTIWLYNDETLEYTYITTIMNTSLTQSGLINGKTYTYLVRACDKVLWSIDTTQNKVSAVPMTAQPPAKAPENENQVPPAPVTESNAVNTTAKQNQVSAPSTKSVTKNPTADDNQGSAPTSSSAGTTNNAAGNNKILLIWAPVLEAINYSKFTYDMNTKNYTLLNDDVTSTSYIHTELKNRITYTYLVKASNGTLWICYPEADHVTASPIESPLITVKAGDNTIILKWNSLIGSSKYLFYRFYTNRYIQLNYNINKTII